MHARLAKLCCGLALVPWLAACAASPAAPAATAATGERPAGWSSASHSSDADPDYAVVFPQDRVNQITITIAPDQWTAMQDNMTELFGAAGQGGNGPGGFGGNGAPPDFPGNGAPPQDGQFPGGGMPGQPPQGAENVAPNGAITPNLQLERGGPPGDLTTENPMWVEATLSFNGQTWTHVGVRYKGNSSLRSSWSSGDGKLPLKLDFDEFEDSYPEIDNQRFYGFKQLALANGFGDATFMRDAVTYDMLEDLGLPAAETAFYEVLIDYGDGPESLGLYTAVEVIDDTVIGRVFGDDAGNIYEGDGAGVSLAAGTTGQQIEASFQKENNKASDWSDISALYSVLHDASRTSDPAAWRARLEQIFAVDDFLTWLALSAAIQHWDTYGSMSHNFYLYHDPDTDKLTWISWDHNLVLGAMGGGMRGNGQAGANGAAPPGQAAGGNGQNGGRGQFQGPGGFGSTSLGREEVGENWPLIRFLLDDPTYHARYLAALERISSSVLEPAALSARYQQLAELIRPYATHNQSAAEFDAAVQSLISTTNERASALTTFLDNPDAQSTPTPGR